MKHTAAHFSAKSIATEMYRHMPVDSDKKYRCLFNSQPDAVFFADRKTRALLDANTAALSLYGYDLAEFTTLKFTDISVDSEEFLASIDKRDSYEPADNTFLQYHRKKSGAIFCAEIAAAVFDFFGHTAICLSVRDTADLKCSKENLKQSKDLLDLIVNSFNGFIYTVSADYRVEFMNDALIEHIGYNAVGEHCYQLIHGLDDRCPWCVGETVFGGRTASFELKCPRNNRWYYYVSTPRLDADGNVTAQQLISIDIHERKRHEYKLLEKRDHLENEVKLLRSATINRYGLDNIVGQSRKMQKIYNLIMEIASSDASVLIYGESGTGKELVAQAIHNLGKRKDKPFLPVNCGGIPDNLIESEFFGYKKGAFTGANSDMAGFLEIGDGGTVFLDEIGEINLNMQVKLLRAIDGDGYTPIGSNQVLRPDVRIIAAANRDSDTLVKNGHMRPDFFFRINVVPVHLPPLRERRDDIPLLIYHFLKKYSRSRSVPHMPAAAMSRLERYDWPGNVRELENIIQRYVVLNRLEVFDSFINKKGDAAPLQEDDPDADVPVPGRFDTLRDAVQDYEKRIITRCLKENHGRRAQAAAILGMNRKTLYDKIQKYGITRF